MSINITFDQWCEKARDIGEITGAEPHPHSRSDQLVDDEGALFWGCPMESIRVEIRLDYDVDHRGKVFMSPKLQCSPTGFGSRDVWFIKRALEAKLDVIKAAEIAYFKLARYTIYKTVEDLPCTECGSRPSRQLRRPCGTCGNAPPKPEEG